MAANIKQKIDKIPIDNNIDTYLEGKFANGWVLNQIVNLNPTQNKLLCIFVKDDTPEINPQ